MKSQLARIPFVMAVAAAAACGAPEPTVDDTTSAIIVVSADVGEVMAAAAPRDAVAFSTDVTAGARLVYANVDFFKDGFAEEIGVVDELGREARLAALREARELGLPILLESNVWDVAQLHAVLGQVFPEYDADGLEHVTVLARMDLATGAWSIEDTTQAELELFLEPSAARAATRGTDAEASRTDTPAAAVGTQDVNPYIDFAEAGWSGPATVTDWAGNVFSRVVSSDVVKVYAGRVSGVKHCIVTWKGTDTRAEWAGDFASQLYSVRPFWLPSSSAARVGWFFNYRLSNQRTPVNDALKDNGCSTIGVTGHSLGGAMATLYTAYLAQASAASGIPVSRLKDFVAFNPARAGNSAFVDTFPRNLRGSSVYCRIGDPVWKVPSALSHVGRGSYGCDLWGVDRNPYPGSAPRTNPWFVNNVKATDVASRSSVRHNWANHASAYWKQCQSLTSC